MMDDNEKIIKYYRFHSKIYDLSRVFFLFGRDNLLNKINKLTASEVLDVGAGTGYFANNLRNPNSKVTALDLSQSMLDKLTKKDKLKNIRLINSSFLEHFGNYDLIVFSYSMTIMHDDLHEIINHTKKLLKQNGIIAVVDFHNTNSNLYYKYMKMHSIELSDKLNNLLCREFDIIENEFKQAYFGIWNYFTFLGRNV